MRLQLVCIYFIVMYLRLVMNNIIYMLLLYVVEISTCFQLLSSNACNLNHARIGPIYNWPL